MRIKLLISAPVVCFHLMPKRHIDYTWELHYADEHKQESHVIAY